MRRTSLFVLFTFLFLSSAAWAVDYEAIEALTPMERIDAYAKLLGVEKDSAEILFKMGNAYFDAEMLEDAAATFRRSLAAGGGFPAFVNLTYVLAESGKREEAEAAYQERISQTPKDAMLYAFYGDFLSEGEDEKRAIRGAMDAYRISLGLDDKCVEAHFGVGSLFARMGLYHEAVREWERLIAIDPNHRLASAARKNLQRVRQEQGR